MNSVVSSLDLWASQDYEADGQYDGDFPPWEELTPAQRNHYREGVLIYFGLDHLLDREDLFEDE